MIAWDGVCRGGVEAAGSSGQQTGGDARWGRCPEAQVGLPRAARFVGVDFLGPPGGRLGWVPASLQALWGDPTYSLAPPSPPPPPVHCRLAPAARKEDGTSSSDSISPRPSPSSPSFSRTMTLPGGCPASNANQCLRTHSISIQPPCPRYSPKARVPSSMLLRELSPAVGGIASRLWHKTGRQAVGVCHGRCRMRSNRRITSRRASITKTLTKQLR